MKSDTLKELYSIACPFNYVAAGTALIAAANAAVHQQVLPAVLYGACAVASAVSGGLIHSRYRRMLPQVTAP